MKNILGYTNQNGCFIETAFATESCIVVTNNSVTDEFLAEHAGKQIIKCDDKEFEYRLLAFEKGLTLYELDKTKEGQNMPTWQS